MIQPTCSAKPVDTGLPMSGGKATGQVNTQKKSTTRSRSNCGRIALTEEQKGVVLRLRSKLAVGTVHTGGTQTLTKAHDIQAQTEHGDLVYSVERAL